MIWFSFKSWNRAGGRFLSWHRLYIRGFWTPFIVGHKRYSSWFGFWGADA